MRQRLLSALAPAVFLLLSEREGESGPLLLLKPLLVGRRKKLPAGGELAATGEGCPAQSKKL